MKIFISLEHALPTIAILAGGYLAYSLIGENILLSVAFLCLSIGVAQETREKLRK